MPSIFPADRHRRISEDDRAINPSEIDIVLKADPATTASCRRPPDRRRSSTTATTTTAGRSRWRRATCSGASSTSTHRRAEADRRARARVLPSSRTSTPTTCSSRRSASRPPEIGRQSYSIAGGERVPDPLFDDIYAFCEAQEIEIDTLIHGDGAAQMEINLIHGDSMSLADQCSCSSARRARPAFRHKMYATFMSKPMAQARQRDAHPPERRGHDRQNVFRRQGRQSESAVLRHIAGLQKYLPSAMAPNVRLT